MLMWKEYCLEHGKGSELLDNQQRASRDDAKKNIFFSCSMQGIQFADLQFHLIK
jgi:hypothetical protein